MMRKALGMWAILLALPFWFSCGRGDKSEVSRAAEACYRYLLEGEYDKYVGAIAYSDSMTDSYRSQMVDLVAQFMAREKEKNGGWLSVRALEDTVSGDVANVFLEIVYADSTREEVALPMVRCGNVWKMQ